MSLNDTPSSERIHIGFFGMRNAGKSSIVNAVTGQDLAIVSAKKGTTTDPVYKTMELLPLGPVVIIDTPGFDDTGELGALRIRKTRQVLNKTDIAILVVDANVGLSVSDKEILQLIQAKKIPYLIVFNKSDLLSGTESPQSKEIYVSARQNIGIHDLKERIGQLNKQNDSGIRIVGEFLKPSDLVILVIPIDKAAPKGRLILPQQQTIRDILDANASALIVKENELANTFSILSKKPALVITDSQVFKRVAKDTPENIPLTSFSILFSRYKGFLDAAVKGILKIESLQDGDTILIAEGCTHHRQCDDIGTVKLPRWIHEYTKKNIHIKTVSGVEFPEDLSPYAMILHCGGCMLNEREVRYRMKCAIDQDVPFTNYGIAIAYMEGILKRSLCLCPDLAKQLQ